MPETILVIEDERLTRTNLIDFLQSEGFTTLDAANGRSGVELAQTHLPDLIICDILMPELDGYDVLTLLQQSPQTASIPFIFLTVSASEDGFRQSIALGADDYLSKPISSEQLRTAIAAQLKKQRYWQSSLKPEWVPLPPTEGRQFGEMPLPITTEQTALWFAKEKLLEQFCQILQKRLIRLRTRVETVHDPSRSADSLSPLGLTTLKEEFAQLLSLVNEVSVLQKTLTASNATVLLEQFVLSTAPEDDLS